MTPPSDTGLELKPAVLRGAEWVNTNRHRGADTEEDTSLSSELPLTLPVLALFLSILIKPCWREADTRERDGWTRLECPRKSVSTTSAYTTKVCEEVKGKIKKNIPGGRFKNIYVCWYRKVCTICSSLHIKFKCMRTEQWGCQKSSHCDSKL